MTIARWSLGVMVCAASGLAVWTACGSSGDDSGFGNPTGSSSSGASGASSSFGGSSSGTSGASGASSSGMPCTGLQCQVHACAGGGSTTISGKVFDPAGKQPLYNIAVFVPNSPPKPFKEGANCDPCASLYTGDAITSALTGPDGKFTLTNVPDGANIPLVIQIGKWRKQLVLPSVSMCTDNPQPDGTLKLPRKHDEPGADIPRIAISTGGSDTLECLLQRVGLDPTEYGAADSGSKGRIEIFHGSLGQAGEHAVPDTSPASPDSYLALWDKKEDLLPYDIVLLSCEGRETVNPNQQALYDYAALGGRVFASHFHYAYFNSGPFDVAPELAQWTAGSNNYNATILADIQTQLYDGGTFPKGVAMKQWLTNTGALDAGQLAIVEARHNAVLTSANANSQQWIVKTDEVPNQTQYFSVNTPLGAAEDKLCGRVVYSDLHIGAASSDNPTLPIPTECANADLSPQEKALEFMLFDLSSCVTPNDVTPQPPPSSSGGVH
ncbi:MAG TPA: carboxypeptidase regulatory-like domain-containing protein [Labilithrix sp.]